MADELLYTPKELLYDTLRDISIGGQSLEDRVFLQGSIDTDTNYPDIFVTISTVNTSDRAFYSNKVTSFDWSFSVILYSSNPRIVYEGAPIIVDALKAEGFLPQGKGRDIPSDVPTHTGWAMDFIFTEFVQN